jgi:copper chaperone
MEHATIEITGMSCQHCVRAVEGALAGLDGVQVEEVRVGSANVAYDPEAVTPAAIEAAIEDEGYEATVTPGAR